MTMQEDLRNAILGTVRRSPGCVTRGIATRLMWSGFANTPSRGFAVRVSHCLNSLADEGELIKDLKGSRPRWYPKKEEINQGEGL